MYCDEYREALSARLDDETWPAAQDQPADRHLEYCVDCALWYEDAALITRRTRTTAAVAWPDVTDAVLARVPATRAADFRPRVALGGLGALLGASALVGLVVQGMSHAAIGFENAAWHLALGVAFVAVAMRRTPARALLPLLGTAVAVLSWGHVTDLLSGRWTTAGMVAHLLLAAGLVLVVLLSRMPSARPGPVPPPIAAATIAPAMKPDIEPVGRPTVIRLVEPAKTA